MKPFNLEEAIAGKAVVTRGGCSVRILCSDCKDNYPIVALVKTVDGADELLETYNLEGKYFGTQMRDSDLDLFMTSVKKTYWVNLYADHAHYYTVETGGTYASEHEASKNISDNSESFKFIKTISVEIEE